MTEPQVLTHPEVAAKLRRSIYWFRRNRRRLQVHGFPEPLPVTSGRLYSAAAVDRWIAGDTDAAMVASEVERREAETRRDRLRARARNLGAGRLRA